MSKAIRIEVLLTFLVDPEEYSADDIETGITSALDSTGVSLQEAPHLESVEVIRESTLWEDGTVISSPLKGWIV